MGDARGGTVARPLPPRLAAVAPRSFVGRTAELAALRRVVSDVAASRGHRIVLLAGQPGVGKTTLAAEAARFAAVHGCAVAYGRAEEGLEGPFGPWRQALQSRWPEGQLERDELFARVLDSVASIAAVTPMLVVLDDLQWADQASLLLIAHTVAAVPSESLALLLSYRTTEAGPVSPLGALLATLAREPGIVRLPIGGLGEEDVEALLSAARGRPLDEDGRRLAKRVWADTKGNAFFVNALLDELEAGGASSTLREVIGHRVARLGDHGAPVLQAAAVVGEVFDPAVVAAVTATEASAVLEVIEAAVADGLITEVSPSGFSFVHALVADALAADLSGPRRRNLHRAAAGALAARDADPTAVARHLAAADPDDHSGRQAAADASIASGLAALDQLAYEDATARLTEAVNMIERWGLDNDRRCTALLALSRAKRLASEGDEALRIAITAFDLAVRLERWHDLAAALLHFPRTATAAPDPALVAVLERAASAAPPTTTVRALVLAALSWVLRYTSDEPRVRALAEEAVALADQIGDRAARAYTRSMLLMASGGDPHPAIHLELARFIEELRGPEERGFLPVETRLRRVYALLRMGELEQFDREIQRAQSSDGRREDLRWWVLTLQAMRAIMEGRLADGEAMRDRAAAIDSPYGELARANAAMGQTATIEYLRGRFGVFAATISDHAQRFPIPALRACLVNALASAGRETEARQLLAELADNDFAAVPRDDAWTTAAFMVADACRLLGARPEAEALYPVLEPYAGEYVVTSVASAACFGAIDRALGQLALVCGWEDRARAHLEEAVRQNARVGARPFLALSRVEQAALGVPGAAEEARAIATELGIDLVLQRLDALDERPAEGGAALRCEGGVWSVTYAGRSVQLKDLRGLHYLRELLTQPGRELAAVELQGGTGDTGTPALDHLAKQAYRRRLEEIDAELSEAEAFGDTGRAAHVTEQRQALAEELARSVGLGGRTRTMGSAAEKARLNVSRAIRAAIDRIAEVHPELGRHLQLAVRTGTYCAYEPDPALTVTWSVS